MPALVHTTFRVSNAKQFKESFEEKTEHGVGGYIPLANMNVDPATGEPSLGAALSAGDGNKIPFYALDDQMYLFIGRVSAWNAYDTPDGVPNPNINENAPPFPVDSMKDSHFNHWDDMIAAKKVSAKEVSHVIKRERADEIQEGVRNWKIGMRYDGYDDRADNLFDDDILIHTVNERFRVYKCLKQGIGRFQLYAHDPATMDLSSVTPADGTYKDSDDNLYVWNHNSFREPQTTITESGLSEDFMTIGNEFNDGYQWKYYYTIDAGEALKFVTTSYIPVRTVRKENGERPIDYTDQYYMEENARPGAIMNVLVDKAPVEKSDGTVLGYEITGGGCGFFQVAFENVQMDLDHTAGTEFVKFTVNDLVDDKVGCHWPDANVAVSYVNTACNKNQFEIGDPGTNDNTKLGYLQRIFDSAGGDAATALGLIMRGYSVWIREGLPNNLADEYMQDRYGSIAWEITDVAWNGLKLELKCDTAVYEKYVGESHYDQALSKKKGIDPLLDTASQTGLTIEIHPKVIVKANHQSSTIADTVDSFEAIAICEPFFSGQEIADSNPEKAYQTAALGRVIDVRVLNPGRYHYRIDSCELAANIAELDDASTTDGTTFLALDPAYSTYQVCAGVLDDVGINAGVDATRIMSKPKLFASIPPVGGHGFDPVGELGGFNVMINARFEGTESDEFTVGNEFRKIGILKNPLGYTNAASYVGGYTDPDARIALNTLWMEPSEYSQLFRGYKTDQCYRFNLDTDTFIESDVVGVDIVNFEPDMDIQFIANNAHTILGDNSLWLSATRMKPDGSQYAYADGDVIATAKLVDHDRINKKIRVIKPRGDFYTVLQGNGSPLKIQSITEHSVKNEPIWGTSKLADDLAEEPGMMPGSGHILYVENRSMVSRSQNQTEDLKISIQF